MSNLYSELRRQLEQGFYLDNLRDIGAQCYRAARQTDRPLGLFVIHRVFFSLDNEWRERPLPVSAAHRMRELIEPPIMQYLEAAEVGLSPELEAEYLNGIVRAFLHWSKIGQELP